MIIWTQSQIETNSFCIIHANGFKSYYTSYILFFI